jgi:asparagine synthase (glutamine-hydrolysing)
MSGYFGVVRRDGKAIDKNLLQRLATKLQFRGADQTSMWAGPEIGGCFTFLETGPAKQAKQQPVVLDGRYYLWGDLRLDGRKELIARLADGTAAHFDDDVSGEDLLLLAWRRWGADCLSQMIGDYSFALWDEAEKCLWCARDFVGARPFFYAATPQALYFGNTLNSFRGLADISEDLDADFLADFLLNGFSSDPERTVYRQIRRLPAGHVLKYANGEVDVRRFLTLAVEEPLRLAKPDDYMQAYRELLEVAVRDCLPAGAAALYLSGGLDSASVCAMAAKIAEESNQRDQLKAFTVSWQPLIADEEAAYAQLTASQLCLQQIVLAEPLALPFEFVSTPEPTTEAFWGRAQRQYRTISQHARVVLAGDGGDDVLTGQAWPYLKYLWQQGAWAGIAKEFGEYIIRNGKIPALRGGFRSKLAQWLPEKEAQAILPEWFSENLQQRAKHLKEMQVAQLPKVETHPLHPAAYAALHSGYWASVLEEEDAGWTGVPLETRAPLLDLRLLRFLLRLPPVPWCVNKDLTRGAMQGRLPEAVLNRPKTPLPEDPLPASIKANSWRPAPPQPPPEAIRQYIQWEKWLATLQTTQGSLDCENLRPLSLVQWLKGIENTEGIE